MIRGQKRNVDECLSQDSVLKANIHNRFDLEVVDARTGNVKQTARAFNVICDGLWSRLFSGSSYFSYIHYGTGTGTPSTSDKSLFSFVGSLSIGGASYRASLKDGVYSRTAKVTILESVAVGETLTEVGIAYGTSSTNLCTHAMLEDMNGNPVSIEKTDTDIINIYATVYVHFDSSGYDNGCIFLYNQNWYDQSIVGILAGGSTSYPDTCYFMTGYPFTAAYYDYERYPRYCVRKTGVTTKRDATNKTFTITMPRLPAADANGVGGIVGVAFGYDNSYNYVRYNASSFVRPGGTWYPYSEIKDESVGTGDGATTDFALDFHFAYDATIYVDGVKCSDVEVLSCPVVTTEPWRFFEFLAEGSAVGCHMPAYDGSGRSFKGEKIFYNHAYETGLASVRLRYYTTLSCSNDLSEWVEVGRMTNSIANVSIPEEYQKSKYWKVVSTSDDGGLYEGSTYITFPATHTGKAIRFTTPPPEGAVITADYKTPVIAKDENHVFDFSLIIQVGEYVET